MDIIIAVAGILAIIAAAGAVWFVRKRPRTLNTAVFQKRWREMQKLLATKDTWQQAIIDADKMLDEALKKKKFGGKTMGERLTRAQRIISDNEGAWFGHKLRSRIESDPAVKLKETEVKQALMGIRQALKDLGALPDGK